MTETQSLEDTANFPHPAMNQTHCQATPSAVVHLKIWRADTPITKQGLESAKVQQCTDTAVRANKT